MFGETGDLILSLLDSDALRGAMIVSADGNTHHPDGAIFTKTPDGREIIVNFEQRRGSRGTPVLSSLSISIAGEPTSYFHSFGDRVDVEAYGHDRGTFSGTEAASLLANRILQLRSATPDKDAAIRALGLRNNQNLDDNPNVLAINTRQFKLVK